MASFRIHTFNSEWKDYVNVKILLITTACNSLSGWPSSENEFNIYVEGSSSAYDEQEVRPMPARALEISASDFTVMPCLQCGLQVGMNKNRCPLPCYSRHHSTTPCRFLHILYFLKDDWHGPYLCFFPYFSTWKLQRTFNIFSVAVQQKAWVTTSVSWAFKLWCWDDKI